MKNERHGNGLAFIIVFFIGGLLGALLSLLFAPQSGRRTRKKIVKASVDAQESIAESAHRAKETMNDFLDQCVERVNEVLEDSRIMPRR